MRTFEYAVYERAFLYIYKVPFCLFVLVSVIIVKLLKSTAKIYVYRLQSSADAEYGLPRLEKILKKYPDTFAFASSVSEVFGMFNK